MLYLLSVAYHLPFSCCVIVSLVPFEKDSLDFPCGEPSFLEVAVPTCGAHATETLEKKNPNAREHDNCFSLLLTIYAKCVSDQTSELMDTIHRTFSHLRMPLHCPL